jgi:hypothetical protein
MLACRYWRSVKIFDIYFCFQFHMYLVPPPNLFQKHILVFLYHVPCIISAVIKITRVSSQLQHGYIFCIYKLCQTLPAQISPSIY